MRASSPDMPALDLMFRALSDRTRLRLLHLLRAHREICVGDLVSVLHVPQAKASRHLAYLRRAGLVRVRRDGIWMHYSLAPAQRATHRALLACLAQCAGDVPERAADLQRYARLRHRCCPPR